MRSELTFEADVHSLPKEQERAHKPNLARAETLEKESARESLLFSMVMANCSHNPSQEEKGHDLLQAPDNSQKVMDCEDEPKKEPR